MWARAHLWPNLQLPLTNQAQTSFGWPGSRIWWEKGQEEPAVHDPTLKNLQGTWERSLAVRGLRGGGDGRDGRETRRTLCRRRLVLLALVPRLALSVSLARVEGGLGLVLLRVGSRHLGCISAGAESRDIKQCERAESNEDGEGDEGKERSRRGGRRGGGRRRRRRLWLRFPFADGSCHVARFCSK